MKLTDEKMNEMILDHWDNSNPLDFNRRDLRDGIKKARDFYENQICETCGKTNNCQIKDTLSENMWHVVIDFGCNHWEQKK